MPRRGSILLTTANEIGSALVDKLGGSGYAPVEWDKKINIMGISSEDIPDALDNLIPSEGGGDRGSILISKANEIGAVLNKKFNTDRGFKPKEWASAISKLTPLQVKTASGAIASFPDGADAVPLTSLVCDINPKQDLHGYSKPWAPGAGKNKFDKDNANVVTGYISTSGFSDGNQNAKTIYIPITGGTTYTVSKTAGQRFQIATSDVVPTNGATYTTRVAQSGSQASLTITAGANDLYLWAWVFLEGTDTGTLEEMLNSIQIELGSTATTWEPYSNVCPIEGSTETTAYQFGKNFWEFGDKTIESVAYIMLYFSTPLPAGTYTISCELTSTTTTCSFRFRKQNGSALIGTTFTANTGTRVSQTLTLTEPAYRVYLYSSTQASGETTTWKDVQIELGSTPTSYEAFKQKTPVVAQFGQTVYVGYVDVVTGILTITHALELLDGSQASSSFGITVKTGYSQVSYVPYISDGVANATFLSDKFYQVAGASSVTGICQMWNSTVPRLFMSLPEEVTNGAQAKAWFESNPVNILYPLATPIEIDLNNSQEVESYLGYNNIYNDTGNTSASYYADIDLNNV